MFQRYNVTSATNEVEALKRTAIHLATLPKSESGHKMSQRLVPDERGQITDNPA